MTSEAAEQTLRAVVSWARFAGRLRATRFGGQADDDTGMFSMENPGEEVEEE